MNILELGAIGELVGGVAVIGSLLYVGLQLRQSNKVAKSESIREIARETGQLYLKTCDPALSLVLRRAIHDFDALTGNEDRRRLLRGVGPFRTDDFRGPVVAEGITGRAPVRLARRSRRSRIMVERFQEKL
jgi:hypothetical protein